MKLCKRLVSENRRVLGLCENLAAFESVSTVSSLSISTAQRSHRSGILAMKQLTHLRSGQQLPVTCHTASNSAMARSAHMSSSSRAFSASGLRAPLRSAAVATAPPAVREAKEQMPTSGILLQSASSSRFGRPQDAAQPSASTSASTSSQASVSGTIQRITYTSEDTGYTVAKMKVTDSKGFSIPASKGRPGLVTVTGKFPEMAAGQQWTCHGTWTKHRSYGPQLTAESAEELRPASSDNLVAYLCGGATKGVGPVTATNMVQTYGDTILDVLDSSDAVVKLSKVKGIGARTAAKIKDEWEKRRGIFGLT